MRSRNADAAWAWPRMTSLLMSLELPAGISQPEELERACSRARRKLSCGEKQVKKYFIKAGGGERLTLRVVRDIPSRWWFALSNLSGETARSADNVGYIIGQCFPLCTNPIISPKIQMKERRNHLHPYYTPSTYQTTSPPVRQALSSSHPSISSHSLPKAFSNDVSKQASQGFQ